MGQSHFSIFFFFLFQLYFLICNTCAHISSSRYLCTRYKFTVTYDAPNYRLSIAMYTLGKSECTNTHTHYTFTHSNSMTSDETFLLSFGGIQTNCLNNILNMKNSHENIELPTIRRSSYYDIEKFIVLAETNKHNFCIFIISSNIQSLNAKFCELEAFVDELATIDFKFSVIFLQESWLAETDDQSLIQLKGYNCISQGKSCSTKCGLVMYIDQELNFEILLQLNTYTNWEGQI